jgi:exportin-7
LNPIIDEKPVFVREIKNAKLYRIGSGDDSINVVHLWGTPYEMGYAHGTIVKQELTGLIETFWKYMESQIVSSIY